MNTDPASTQGLALHLLLLEAGEQRESAALVDASHRIGTRLHRRMVRLIGRAGFAALFARALHLARAAHPELAGITFDDQSGIVLIGLDEFAATRTPTEVGAALAIILAQFIELLNAFIGEELTLRLLGEIWQLPGDDAAHAADAEAKG